MALSPNGMATSSAVARAAVVAGGCSECAEKALTEFDARPLFAVDGAVNQIELSH
jgi:hypothetical protein